MKQEFEFIVATAHNMYFCENHEAFIKKTKALRTLNIPFNFYYKVGGEWVNMSHTPKDMLMMCK